MVVSGELDLELKLGAAAALSATGYYCKVNVALSAHGEDGLADVTDVDVLAIRHDITFAPRIIAVSCKSGSSLGLSKELFYLRGVLDYLEGDEGVVLLSKKPLPAQLRDLGRRLSLLCLHGAETSAWFGSMMRGAPDTRYFEAKAFDTYAGAVAADKGSPGLLGYIKADFWFFRDFRNIQNLIAHLKKAPRMTGDRPEDTVRFLHVANHFIISVLELCRHVQLAGVHRAEASVHSYLFGGEANLKVRRDMYQRLSELLAHTGVAKDAALPALMPAYVGALVELVIRFIERPQAAVLVPQAIQNALWRALGAPGWPPEVEDEVSHLAAQKFADDLLSFLKLAAERSWAPVVMTRAARVAGAGGPHEQRSLFEPPK